ncbi:MAG TPA: sigma-70 family RNA polymerase sigma factor [Ktedonobacterales bacterium]
MLPEPESSVRVSASAASGEPAHRDMTSAAEIAARLAAARPRLLWLARLRGVAAGDAEDVVQETLLTAWRAAGGLRDPQRFDAWLDGVLRNFCRRYTAALGDDVGTLDALGSDGPVEEEDPLESLTQQDLATLIDAALGHLRASARAALELRYLAELPAGEVAARLGVTLNTLDARLSRARRQLRETLAGPLRERAVEFGLALGPADDAGWRNSRIWCRFCGQAQMRGILEDAPDGGGRMVLRCPVCYQKGGAEETNIGSIRAIQGLTSFRVAEKRLLRMAQEHLTLSLQREAPCVLCGGPARARIVAGHELAADSPLMALFPHHFFVITECPRCEGFTNGAAGIAATHSPDIARFIIENQRMLVEPEELTVYNSSPAIRFSLFNRASGERMVYFADPATLDLRGVHRG